MDRLPFALFLFSLFGLQRINVNGGNTGCQERSLIGENSKTTIDANYTASSHYENKEYAVNGKDSRYEPHNAKLNGSHGWAPADKSNTNDFLQIDLGTLRVITAVATQGSGDKAEWVTTYELDYTNDLQSWTSYKDNQKVKLFQGNRDSNGVVHHNLAHPIFARSIRFIPVEYHVWKTMRVNMYFICEELGVTTIPKQTSVRIDWTYKSCTSIKRVTGYLVKVGSKTQELDGNHRTYNFTNLRPYTEYDMTLKAGAGNVVCSRTERFKTTMAEPEAIPTITVIHAISSKSIAMKWKLSSDNTINGPLDGYNISYTPQGGKTQTINVGNVTSYTVKSLLKYTTYSITVAVRNTKYTGPPSTIMTVQTMEDEPEERPLLKAKETSSQTIMLTWELENPKLIHGPLRGYKITYTPQGGETKSTNVKGDVTTHTLTSLSKNTTYSISVAVRNTKYTGPPSKIITVRTMEDGEIICYYNLI